MSKLKGHSGTVTGVAWSAEGKLATCSEDRTVVTSDDPGSGGAVGSPAEARLTAASVDTTLGFRDAADDWDGVWSIALLRVFIDRLQAK